MKKEFTAKTLDEANFLAEAKELQALCRERGVPFLVNDNVEIAREMDADGVHVGQSDMEAQDVRALLGPDKILACQRRPWSRRFWQKSTVQITSA